MSTKKNEVKTYTVKIELWNKHRAGGKKGKDVKEEQAVFHKLDTGDWYLWYYTHVIDQLTMEVVLYQAFLCLFDHYGDSPSSDDSSHEQQSVTDLSPTESTAPPIPERQGEAESPTVQASGATSSKGSHSKKRSRYKPRVKRRVTGIVPPNLKDLEIPERYEEDTSTGQPDTQDQQEEVTSQPDPEAEEDITTSADGAGGSADDDIPDDSDDSTAVGSDGEDPNSLNDATDTTPPMSDDDSNAASASTANTTSTTTQPKQEENKLLTPEERKLKVYNDRNRMLQEELERTNVELANLQYRYDGFMQGMDMLRRMNFTKSRRVRQQFQALMELREENEWLKREKEALIAMIHQLNPNKEEL